MLTELWKIPMYVHIKRDMQIIFIEMSLMSIIVGLGICHLGLIFKAIHVKYQTNFITNKRRCYDEYKSLNRILEYLF